ncbi:MAG: hypothetical protein AAF388_01105 [Bacteroidota bacterium]
MKSSSTSKSYMEDINKALLQKYFNGDCSSAEKARVEAWLASDEYETTPLPFDATTKADIKSSMWKNITADMDSEGLATERDAPVVPLHRRVLRYAAAACLLIAVFFGGRISASYFNTKTKTDKSPHDHLYIAGGNGAQGHLPGDYFKVKFDGTLRLYNDGLMPKTIEVGDTTFALLPKQTYYLEGSVERPQLLGIGSYTYPDNDFQDLRGYFSILRMDNKE